MDNTGHYFCLQSSALTHSLSLFIHTDLSEGCKPVRFPPPFSALEVTNQVFQSSDASLFMALWGFPDCAVNCVLNRVGKHMICKKED